MSKSLSRSSTFASLLAGGTLFVLAGCPMDPLPPDNMDMGQSGDLVPVTVVRMGSGSVTSTPAGFSCGDQCGTQLAVGTQINLTATPESGFLFSGWGGACSGTDPVCSITVDRALSITAAFTRVEMHPLTVIRSGSGTLSNRAQRRLHSGAARAVFLHAATPSL